MAHDPEEEARLMADAFIQLANVTSAAALIEREAEALRVNAAKLALRIDTYLRGLMVERASEKVRRERGERHG